jgi:hypothetical protein
MYSLKIVRRAIGVTTVAVALVFTSASFAQQQGRIRGQIEKTDDGMLSLKQRDGTMLDVKLHRSVFCSHFPARAARRRRGSALQLGREARQHNDKCLRGKQCDREGWPRGAGKI